MTELRSIQRIIESKPASDGAGVKLRRSLGQQAHDSARLDPFLMLDEFYSDNPDDYIAGFPSHPHRGFETVTYMLEGRMQHRDHLGNIGEVGPGGVQWMTAGSGVIHSEMPQQSEGAMRGFQLWLNLPAAEKMTPAMYRDIPGSEIPELAHNGALVRVIAGQIELGGEAAVGAVDRAFGEKSTRPLYLDIRLKHGAKLSLPIEASAQALVYLYDGAARIGKLELPHRAAGLLGAGDRVEIAAGSDGAGLLLLAGKPIGEPIAQYGPFVMNSRQELEQAIADYRDGRLTDVAG